MPAPSPEARARLVDSASAALLDLFICYCLVLCLQSPLDNRSNRLILKHYIASRRCAQSPPMPLAESTIARGRPLAHADRLSACRIHHRPRPLPRHTRTGGSACCPPWIRLSGRLQNPPLHLSSPRLDDISARKHAGGRPPCGGRGSGGVGGLGRHRCRSEVRLLADPEKP
jgi:hypothetical protein